MRYVNLCRIAYTRVSYHYIYVCRIISIVVVIVVVPHIPLTSPPKTGGKVSSSSCPTLYLGRQRGYRKSERHGEKDTHSGTPTKITSFCT